MKTKPSTEYVLLGILMSGPKHGYEIMQFLDSALESTWRVSTSQLYTLLKRLESGRLLKSSVEPQETRPSRRVFALTNTGKEAFLKWLHGPTEHVRDFRIEFVGKLFFFDHLSLEGAEELIGTQIERLAASKEKIRQQLEREHHLFNKLVYGLKMETVACYITWLSGYREAFLIKDRRRGTQSSEKETSCRPAPATQ